MQLIGVVHLDGFRPAKRGFRFVISTEKTIIARGLQLITKLNTKTNCYGNLIVSRMSDLHLLIDTYVNQSNRHDF